MPKISKHNGPSHKGEPRPTVPEPVIEVHLDLSSDDRFADMIRKWVRTDGGGNVAFSGDDDSTTVEVTGPDLVTKDEGGEESSPGSSSSASTPTQPTSSEPSKPARRRRAPMTGSRSGQDQTGSSSAPSTAGDPTAPTSATEPEQDEQAP